MNNLFDFDFTAENTAAATTTATAAETAAAPGLSRMRISNIREILATMPKREPEPVKPSAMQQIIETIKADSDDLAQAAAKKDDEIKEMLRAERVRELRDLAESAYEENRLDDYFDLMDKIERLEAGEDEEPEPEMTIPEPKKKEEPGLQPEEEPEPEAVMNFMAQEIVLGCSRVSEPRGKALSSVDAEKIFRQSWPAAEINFRESFKALYLNHQNEVIGIMTIGVGGFVDCPVDVRLLYAGALKVGATGLIVAHNHPSGNLRPSREDEKLTKKIAEAGKVLDIRFLDHMIITEKGIFSFLDNGLL